MIVALPGYGDDDEHDDDDQRLVKVHNATVKHAT